MLYVITGPPAGGKSTWIQARATPRDIVIDMDRIASALTGPGAPAWNQDPTVQRVAQRARFAAIDEAVKHLDAAAASERHSSGITPRNQTDSHGM